MHSWWISSWLQRIVLNEQETVTEAWLLNPQLKKVIKVDKRGGTTAASIQLRRPPTSSKQDTS